ncbi:non-specific lipid transfer protein GPI-anchored 20-like [Lycium ferocissimum]|uniref:non-specific lipid transfer protein GPI-anchored 20-like n=1 Tax=Lycium ferocissimum TaxID=112874 RepID=UPI002814E4F8|nr:non-specific lipid transfer protein GPI-anchored 20-like [Lycium ferocissimum]
MAFKHLTSPILVLSWLLIASYRTVEGQIISTPCTGSMITSFTPCVNFLTSSSSNGTSPTEDCCNALRTMMTNSTNCLCLIVTGGIPFQMPMNPNIAMSLPRACNMPGVPLKCKAPSPPTVVAPGPRSDAGSPSASPTAAPTSAPRNPKDSTVSPPSPLNSSPPGDEIPSLTPPSPPVDSSTPATNSGSQTPVTPSAAPTLGYGISSLLAAFGAIVLSLY